MRPLDSILNGYDGRLLDAGLPILIRDIHELDTLKREDLIGNHLINIIPQEDLEFYSQFKENLLLSGQKRELKAKIAELIGIHHQKSHDRFSYDADKPLRDRHEQLLGELSDAVTPYCLDSPFSEEEEFIVGEYPEHDGDECVPEQTENYQETEHHQEKEISEKKKILDTILRKSIDVIVEAYRDDKRKNGNDYAVFHPFGMARAMNYLGNYFKLDPLLVQVMMIAALRHDMGELLQERNDRFTDLREYFRSNDSRIRNYVANKVGLTPEIEDILDAGNILSLLLTTPADAFWDDTVKIAAHPKNMKDLLEQEFPDDKMKQERIYPLLRAGIILVKLADLNYNMLDFDDVRKRKEETFSLRTRGKQQFKSLYFFNVLSTIYTKEEISSDLNLQNAMNPLKRSLMHNLCEESLRCMSYILTGPRGKRLSWSYITTLDDHLVTFEKNEGYEKANHIHAVQEVALHPELRFDGILYSMQRYLWEKQMRKGIEKKTTKRLRDVKTVNFGNPRAAFDYFISVRRLGELNYINPFRRVLSFTIIPGMTER